MSTSRNGGSGVASVTARITRITLYIILGLGFLYRPLVVC